MLAIAYTFSNDKSVSQDIVQEIFAKLWARQAELNIEYLKRGCLSTYGIIVR